MKIAVTLVLIPLSILPLFAFGQTINPSQNKSISGGYMSFNFGLNYLEHVGTQPINVPGASSGLTGNAPNVVGGKLDGGPGIGGLLAVGYGFGNGIRAELEFNVRNNATTYTLSSPVVVGGAPGWSGNGGTVTQFGPMLNFAFDFTTPWDTINKFNPYFGMGIGYDAVRISGVSASSANIQPPATLSFGGGTQGALAAQGFVGAAYPIATDSVRGLALTTDFRYFSTIGNLKYRGSVSQNGKVEPVSPKIGDLGNLSLMIGLRWAFGAPEPQSAGEAPFVTNPASH